MQPSLTSSPGISRAYLRGELAKRDRIIAEQNIVIESLKQKREEVLQKMDVVLAENRELKRTVNDLRIELQCERQANASMRAALAKQS